jgi:predicted RNase H-like nuclease (RuvC/YqgF family)
MPTKTYIEESKVEWWGTNEQATHDQIQIGCLQRIASATEKMAQRYTDMQSDLEWYKKRDSQNRETIQRLTRSNNALRGHINRMKRLSK